MKEGNNMMQNFHILFSIFMAIFYLGSGIFFLFFADMFNIDRAIRGIIGSTFLLYGLYRVYTVYRMISDTFFSKNDRNENM
jgi:hypothetical protein